MDVSAYKGPLLDIKVSLRAFTLHGPHPPARGYLFQFVVPVGRRSFYAAFAPTAVNSATDITRPMTFSLLIR